MAGQQRVQSVVSFQLRVLQSSNFLDGRCSRLSSQMGCATLLRVELRYYVAGLTSPPLALDAVEIALPFPTLCPHRRVMLVLVLMGRGKVARIERALGSSIACSHRAQHGMHESL